MGQSCCKDQADQPAPTSVESERRLDVLARQETELTEKQSRYLALVSQLEEEKAKVAAARKDLTEALSENEIFKSTLKELHTRLRESESAANQRKDALEGASRPSVPPSDSETETQLQAELSALQTQTQLLLSELQDKKAHLELQQLRLRDAEKTVALLEKLELELEHQLAEEASKHEQARKKAYLRGLFLIALRKVQGKRLQYLFLWRKQTKNRTRIKTLLQELKWTACPELEPLRRLLSLVPSSEIAVKTRAILEEITFDSGKLSASWKDCYEGSEEELSQAALISVCISRQQDIQEALEALESTVSQGEEVAASWKEEKTNLHAKLDSVATDTNSVLERLRSVPVEILDSALQRTVTELSERVTAAQTSCVQTQVQLSGLENELHSALAALALPSLADLRNQLKTYRDTAMLPSPQLQTRISTQEEVTESAEISNIEEPQVAALPEETLEEAATDFVETTVASEALESVRLPADLSPEDRESVLTCPTLIALQLLPTADILILPVQDVLSTLENLLKVFASPTAVLWDSVLDYFVRVHGQANSPRLLSEFASNIQSFDEHSYVSLLASALGLSLQRPVPISLAYGRVVVAAALGGHIDNPETGGELPLIDVIKLTRRLFQGAPEAGKEALTRLKPESLETHSYMNFLLCARLSELGKDSLQLFKSIDSEAKGNITCPELLTGILDKLDLWVHADQLSSLMSHIDQDNSGTISRLEFAREVTLKTYYRLVEELKVTRSRCVELLSGLVPRQVRSVSELHSETGTWLEALAAHRLAVLD